jgi:adenylate kinase
MLDSSFGEYGVGVTIAVFGISGVGKSRLISSFGNPDGFVHVQASELLKRAKEAAGGGSVSAEDLRQGAVLDNQSFLVSAFKAFSSAECKNIIFDGHTVIDGGASLIEVPIEVIASIDPAGVIFVWDEPATIARRRLADAKRQRPSRTAAELDEHQRRAETLSRAYAEKLSIPFARVRSGDEDQFATSITAVLKL